MVNLGAIDAPTAAILGGLTGFLADNITSFIQRIIDSRVQDIKEKIEWYEETQRLAREIIIVVITYSKREEYVKEIKSILPTNEEIGEISQNADLEEMMDGKVEIEGVEIGTEIDVHGNDVTEQEIRERWKQEIRQDIENILPNRYDVDQDVVAQRMKEEMKTYQSELTEHLASCNFSVNESVQDSLTTLLSHCFGLTLNGELWDDSKEEIEEVAIEIFEDCEREISDLESQSLLV